MTLAHVHRAPRGAGDSRGTALVEFALVLPVLFSLLYGIISYGLAYNQKISLTNAAAEGARYAATVPPSQAFTTGTWATNVRDLVIARANGDLDAASATVCVSLVKGATATTYNTGQAATWFTTNTSGLPCVTTDTYATTASDNGIRAQVVVTRPATIQTVFLTKTVTQTGKAIAQSASAS
ncbi:MAG: pilus assembly protein [Acidimicrobiales bacterium]|nr:pilus assembly protein [Acidimicrobiales bacterium]